MNTDRTYNNHLDSAEPVPFQAFTFSWLIFRLLRLCGIDFSKQTDGNLEVDGNTKKDNRTIDTVRATKCDVEVSKTTDKVQPVKNKKRKKYPKDHYYPPFGKDKIAVIDEFIRGNKHIIYLMIVVAFIVTAYPHAPFLKTAIIMMAFIGLGAISRIWLRVIPFQSLGIELILLFTIISGRLFGPVAGVIVGVTSMVLSAIISDEEPMKLWPAFVAIAIVGHLSGVLTIASISVLGIVLTILYDIIISVIYYFLGSSGAKIILFDVTHITWNYWVFYNVAPWLLLLIA
ncbi:MAG: ECF transporter S component [Candidatus Aenigmarchaeota archaeon]|nr:ECF transporter S component [Candidatus Aenigmarchaeota archaeon]